jgi:hypothetical protein
VCMVLTKLLRKEIPRDGIECLRKLALFYFRVMSFQTDHSVDLKPLKQGLNSQPTFLTSHYIFDM